MYEYTNQKNSAFETLSKWLKTHRGCSTLSDVLRSSEKGFITKHYTEYARFKNSTEDDMQIEEELRKFYRAVSIASHKAKHLFLSLYALSAGEKPAKAGMLSELPNFFEDIISYSNIFDSISVANDGPDLFSPLAYFVDLLRIVETYITADFNIPAGHTLRDRRPDLYTLPLSAANEDNMLPYTEIIHKRLVGLLQKSDPSAFGTDPNNDSAIKKYCAEHVYPANLPFSFPYLTVSAALTKKDYSPAQLFTIFDAPSEQVPTAFGASAPSTELTALVLGTSVDYLEKLNTCNEEFYPELYGLADYSKVDGHVVARTLGVSLEELAYLLVRDIDSDEEFDIAAPSFYINKGLTQCLRLSTDEGDGSVTVTGLTASGIANLVKFVRFAALTGLTCEQLDAITTNDDINASVSLFAAVCNMQIKPDKLLPLISSLYSYGKSSTFKAVFGDSLSHEEKYKFLDILSTLAKVFSLSENEMEALSSFLYHSLENVSSLELNAFYRNVSMARLIGVGMDEYISFAKLLGIRPEMLCGVFSAEVVSSFLSYTQLCSINTYEADYILNGQESAFCGAGFGTEDIGNFIQDIKDCVSGFSVEQKNSAVRQSLIRLIGINATVAENLFNVIPAAPKECKTWEETFYEDGKEDFANNVAMWLARANRLILKLPVDVFVLFSDEFFGKDFNQIGYDKLVTLCGCAKYYSLNPVFFMLSADAIAKNDKTGLAVLCAISEADVDLLIQPLALSLAGILQFAKRLDSFKSVALSISNISNYLAALTKKNGYDDLCAIASKITLPDHGGSDYCAALADIAVCELGKTYGDISDTEDLSAYLLLDVKMDESVEVSYIREGINAVLDYLNRCRLGLEPGVGRIETISDEYWSWVMDYSEWKANRMLFVFPENYLLPEIRTSQSEIFKQALQGIAGKPLDAAAAETFYADYLDAYAKISDIVPCASYLSSDMGSEQLYLFGRTITDNKLHYCIRKDAIWSEWIEISAFIPEVEITPIFIFGKLYIFWIECLPGTSPEIFYSPTDGNDTTPAFLQNTPAITNISVKYTYRNMSGTWSAEKTLFNDVYVLEDPKTNYGKQFLNSYDTECDGYRRLSAFRITEKNFCDSSGKYYINQTSEKEKLLIMLGGFVYTFPNETIDEYFPLTNPYDTVERSVFSNSHASTCDKINILSERSISGHLCSGCVRVYGSSLREEHIVSDGEFFIFDEYTGGAKAVAPAVSVDESSSIVGSILNADILKNTLSSTPNTITKFVGQSLPEYLFSKKGNNYIGEFSSTLNTYILGADMEKTTTTLTNFQIYLNSVKIINFDNQPDGSVRIAPQNLKSAKFYSKKANPGILPVQFSELYSILLQCMGSQNLLGSSSNRLAADTEIIKTANLAGAFIVKTGGMGGEAFLLTPVPVAGKDGKPAQLTPTDSAIVISYPKITVNDIEKVVGSEQKGNIYDIFQAGSSPIIDGDGYIYMPNVTEENIKTALDDIYDNPPDEIVKDLFALLNNRGLASSYMFWSKNVDKKTSINIYNALTDCTINGYATIPVDTTLAMNMNPKEKLWETNTIGTNTPSDVSSFFSRYVNSPLPISLRYSANSEYAFDVSAIKYDVTRITNATLPYIAPSFSAGGVDAFLKLENQQAPVPAILPIERFSPNTKALNLPYALDGAQPDFDGLYRNYNYELFYHIPMFAAKSLCDFGNYADAKKWLEYIYSPLADEKFLTKQILTPIIPNKEDICTDILEKTELIIPVSKDMWRVKNAFCYTDFQKSGAEEQLRHKGFSQEELNNVVAILTNYTLGGMYGYCWQFFPFRTRNIEDLIEDLKDSAQLRNYHNNPFDPHAIASLRIGAYEKYTVLEYAGLLIEWGDREFAKLTWDSIANAYSLYQMAKEILGERPAILKQSSKKSNEKCFDDLYHESKTFIASALLEKLMRILIEEGSQQAPETLYDPEFFIPYFKIPINNAALAKWDTVEDRLYKIRNNLDINGNVRSIPLFSAAADPLKLAMMKSAGFSPSAKNPAAVTDNWYKYSMLYAYARDFTGTLIQFSAQLLSAIEKGDNEKLRLLITGQSQELTAFTKLMKKNTIDALEKEQEALMTAKEAATGRLAYFTKLVDGNISFLENLAIFQNVSAAEMNIVSALYAIEGGVLALIPDLGSPFALTYGGSELSASMMNFSMASMSAAAALNTTASVTDMYAGYARRYAEWVLQKKETQHNLDQIESQLAAGELRIEAARNESLSVERMEEHNADLMDFYKSKFSSYNLYSSLSSLLRQTVFTSYQTAVELAARAEKAWQEETDSNSAFLTYTYWDDAKCGLLSGEALMTALNTMQSAYIAKNPRRLEITKTISLAESCPNAFTQLQNDGECIFALTLDMFDQSNPPVNYLHKIRTITISTQVVIGAYQTISAKLTQIGSAILYDRSNQEAVEYVVNYGKKESGTTVPDGVIDNRRVGQSISISNTQNESGMHFFDYSGSAYLPFEGTGAVSKWQLKYGTNPFKTADIDDIIMNVAYTAMPYGNSIV